MCTLACFIAFQLYTKTSLPKKKARGSKKNLHENRIQKIRRTIMSRELCPRQRERNGTAEKLIHKISFTLR